MIFLLILCLGFEFAQAQIIITKTREFSSKKNNFHQIANEFAYEVGNTLKQMYPAKVEKVLVKLEVIDKSLHLTYTAEIIKCDKNDAQYYFDHRGTLMIDYKLSYALSYAISTTLEKEKKVIKAFNSVYGSSKIISRNSTNVKYVGNSWVVYEIFIVSFKPKESQEKNEIIN